MIAGLVDNCSRWLLPPRCGYCAAATDGLPVCPACAADLPWNDCACPGCARPQSHSALCGRCAQKPPPYDRAWTAFALASPVQQAIHGLKYRGRLIEAYSLGRLIAERLPSRPDLIRAYHPSPAVSQGRTVAWLGSSLYTLSTDLHTNTTYLRGHSDAVTAPSSLTLIAPHVTPVVGKALKISGVLR